MPFQTAVEFKKSPRQVLGILRLHFEMQQDDLRLSSLQRDLHNHVGELVSGLSLAEKLADLCGIKSRFDFPIDPCRDRRVKTG